ncbi:MAG TPA: alpha/beta hydrolase [Terriglobales bacterium]|nr:alpha/beta hydrolase [Terriglobales bacterium]
MLKFRNAVLVFLCALLISSAWAQVSAPTQQPTSVSEWTDLAYSSFETIPNITYRRANNTDLKLDLYLPHERTQPVPLLILIHGGGWVAGNRESIVLQTLPYLQMGFAVANVQYRLASNTPAPAAVEDCRCALSWLFHNAARYNFDVNRIVTTGGSAGGHLALTTGLLNAEAGFDRGCTPPDDMRWDKAPTTQPRVAAIINWFGITDVADLFSGPNAKGYAIEWFGSIDNRDQLARRLSPAYIVSKTSPPVLTIHGDKDTLVPYAHAQKLHEALTRAGVRNQLITIPNGGHGGFSLDEMRKTMTAIRAFLRDNKIVQ